MRSYIRNHFLLLFFFFLLFSGLFLGDGQQLLIDVTSAGGILVFTSFAFFYGKKQREVPFLPSLFLSVFLTYLLLQIPFSDDIGYSVYSFVRMIDGFIVFYVFYCYMSEENRQEFPHYIIWFCLCALLLSFIYIGFPVLTTYLPNTNLLVPTYGHNNVVYILLFGIPITFFSLVRKMKRKDILLLVFFVFGVFLSFARGAMILVSIFFLFGIFFYRFFRKRINHIYVAVVSLVLVAGLAFSLFVPQESYNHFFTNALLPKMTKEVTLGKNRFEYFQHAFISFRERPLFGSGLGTFYFQSKRLQNSANSYSRYAHNIFLEFLSDTGLVGIFLFAFPLSWVVYKIVRIFLYKNYEHNSVVLVLLSGLLLQTFAALIDFSLNYLVIELLFYSSLAVLVSFDTHHQSAYRHFVQYVLSVYISIVFVFYIAISFCSMNRNFSKSYVGRCCFLSEFISLDFLKGNKSASLTDVQVIDLLHKKNPAIQCPLYFYFVENGLAPQARSSFFRCIKYDPFNRFTLLKSIVMKKKDDTDPTYDDQLFDLLLSYRIDPTFTEVDLSYDEKMRMIHTMEIYAPIEKSYMFTKKENAFIYYILSQGYSVQFEFDKAQHMIQQAIHFDESNPRYIKVSEYFTYLNSDFSNPTIVSKVQSIIDGNIDKPIYERIIIAELSYRMSLHYVSIGDSQQARYYRNKAKKYCPWREVYND